MKIVAISGHAQNGKDTIAGMLKTRLERQGKRVLITHYADLLKYICKAFFGWNGEKDEKGRKLLQEVGTDVIRGQQPDFWVNFTIQMLQFFGDKWDFVLIPDSRFPNEIDALKNKGFDVTHLRIVRTNFKSPLTEEQQRHPSETALDDVVPDIVVWNSGSLQDLEYKADDLVYDLG